MNSQQQFENLSAEQKRRVFVEAFAEVIDMAPIGALLLPTFVLTVSFVSGLLQSRPTEATSLFAIATVLAAARILQVRPGRALVERDPQRFIRNFSVLLVTTGVLWAVFAVWAALRSPEEWLAYLLLAISVTIPSMSVFSFGAIPRVGFAYACLCLLPIAGVFGFQGTYEGAVTAALCVPYLGVIYLALARSERRLCSDLVQREQMKEAAAELQAARELAEQANRAKSDFLATISHEFRMPMHALLGFSDILRANIGDAEEIEVIDDATEQLVKLIDRIVQFATLDDPAGQPSETEPCQVRELSTQFLYELNRDQPVKVAIQVEDSVPRWVQVDRQALSRLLEELVGNAVKFSRDAHVQVRIRHRSADNTLVLEVDDLGPGIAKDQQDRIFLPFTQVRNADGEKPRGAGLGLALCTAATQAAGGALQLRRSGPSGSLFEAILPAEPCDAPVVMPLSQAAVTRKILVVDDDVINRLVALRMLQGLGFEVVVATGGAQGVQLAMESEFAAILMDCQMPVVDGYEATRQIRGQPGPCKQAPILALTADVLPGAKQRCLDAGMNGYLQKPARSQQLREGLQRVGVASQG